MDWRNLERLPEATGETWQARRGRGPVFADKHAIDAAAAKWTPLDPLLVCPPGGRRFVPVLAVDEYREIARRSYHRRQLALVVVLVLLAGGLAVSGWAVGRASALHTALAALAIAGFAALEYGLSIKQPDVLFDRALLRLWVGDRGRVYAVGWAVVMLAAGALQLAGQHLLGGWEPLVLKLGAVHARILDGELWRLVVGPFLHSDAVHWAGNLALLVFAGAIAGALMGRASIVLFVGASSFGALMSALLASRTHLDAYLGVSAGIFALLGWCGGAALRRPGGFPRHFAATALGFAAMIFIAAAALNPAASNLGHAAGLLAGLAWGVVSPGREFGEAARAQAPDAVE